MIVFFVALAWLGGIGVAALGGEALWPPIALGGAGVSLGLLAGGRRRHLLAVTALTAVCLAGLWRYDDAGPAAEPGGVAAFNDGGAVTLRGTIVGEPEARDRSQRFSLRVDAYDDGGAWSATEGRVLVTTRLFPRFDYGDRLELRGKLETPPRFEDFDYREYLARRGIVSLAAYPSIRRTGADGGNDLVRGLLDLRRPLGDALERSLPEPESALARGILLGERASIPRDLTDDLNRAGISHLVAISGWNVALVAGFSVGALAWLLGRRPAVAAAMLIVVVYALFVGASPSVLRAAVMGEVMLGATLAGRPGSALGAVLFAGAALTAWQPLIVDDVSFQLSFAATVGIVLVAANLAERLQAALPSWLAELTAVTVAASVAVLPVIVASFGRVSLVALPANLLTVPAFPVIILGSGLTALAGVVSTDLGRFVGNVAYLPLTYLVHVGRAAADLPAASVSIDGLGTAEAAALYGLVALLIIAVLRWRPRLPEPRPSPRIRPALLASVVMLALAAAVWRDALSAGEARLEVTVLDVGQGDAILIETPAGQRILVDGGPSGDRLLQALGRELPASAHRVDLVVLTHGQDDHVTGLVSLLERFDVGAVLTSPLPGETAAYRAWRDAVERRTVPLREAVAGEWVDLGGGLRLEVLGPPPRLIRGTADQLNDNSVVLRLVFGPVSFLLTGDLAAAGEEALLAGGGDLRATVLKVGHHGSDGSTTSPFLRAVRPGMAVISVGAENPFGHPSPTTLLRLAGVPYLRTDHNGRVRFRTDGDALWVDYDRGAFRRIEPASGK